MDFTKAQQAAIDARNRDVLVSAAAGSGKTAVLVERVVSLLKEGKRIDRMLIVTFTRAAAGEMRERIAARLEEEEQDAHLRRQLMLLPRAAISTLHVFCSGLLREHFEAVGIDPMCRIADEDKLDALHRRALDQVMEKMYAQPDADQKALAEQFEDAQIEEMLGRTEKFLLAQADPVGWAEAQSREENHGIDQWMPLLQMLCRAHLSGAEERMADMERMTLLPGFPERYLKTVEMDGQLMQELLTAAQDGRLTGDETGFQRLSSKKASPDEDPVLAQQYKDTREEWRGCIKEARKLLPADPQKAGRDVLHTLPALRALFAMTREVMDAYFQMKQKRNYLDYGDLEHLAMKALRDERVRQDVASRYDAIFVDEYQDVSGIQEAILSALHEGQNNMMFMVGDVKQSIYRFRLADPTLFLEKYRTFSEDADAPQRKIIFQQNFRSDHNVLAAVNQVFSHAMREKETEIEYDEAAMLYPGGNKREGAAAEIVLLHAGEDEDGPGELTRAYRYEAAFVARRIREMMKTVQVMDKKNLRPLKYRDIALLIRNASGRAPFIARVLQNAGIPVYSDADAQFFDLPEVADMLNLLRVVDNPLQDIPLMSALRCPCFDFTEEELARIRLVDQGPHVPFHQAFLKLLEKEGTLGEKARKTWAQLNEWRFLSVNLPLDRLLWRMLEDSGLYMRAGCLEDGELRQANLRLLVERAQGETAAEGLNAFLRETGRIHAGDDLKTAKTLGENEDVVRILTMHKSKGLQFPVVFLLETARDFNKDRDYTLRLHMRHGAALKYVDADGRITRETCAQIALKGLDDREKRAEEARLLYVAMTRAEERLIIVGAPKRLEKCREKWARPATAYAAGHTGCMLDWIMESLEGGQEGQFEAANGSIWRLTLEEADENAFARKADMPPPPLALQPPSDAMRVLMEREEETGETLKTSVSAVVKQIRLSEDDWESPADKRIMQEESPLPSFLVQQEITAAHRGTVTHRVLGLMDLALAREGKFRQALDQLEEKRLLTQEERNAIRITWLKNFYQSPLGCRMLAAHPVRREWAFNLAGENGTLIQGVIDLCFLEADGWVLLDYKTDKAEDEEILHRYRLQMQWYKKALEKITGKQVKETYLFALRSGHAIEVKEE
ncbi:MAG: UvrD-helicase domain-containing protein [Clostridia bacterium]|nr:UvrD-helicase domain-containing protein [Clostridia bacterium]